MITALKIPLQPLIKSFHFWSHFKLNSSTKCMIKTLCSMKKNLIRSWLHAESFNGSGCVCVSFSHRKSVFVFLYVSKTHASLPFIKLDKICMIWHCGPFQCAATKLNVHTRTLTRIRFDVKPIEWKLLFCKGKSEFSFKTPYDFNPTN